MLTLLDFGIWNMNRSDMCKVSYWVTFPLYELTPYVNIKDKNQNISKYPGKPGLPPC